MRWRLPLALAFLTCGAGFAQHTGFQVLHNGNVHSVLEEVVEILSSSDKRQEQTAASATITSPAADPIAVSGSPQVVSGTTTGTVSSIGWATSPEGASGSCANAGGAFSCSVTSTIGAAQTVTVTAYGPVGNGSDTIVLNFPTFDWQPGSTSPNDLSDSLTVAGTPMDLVFSCYATDVSGTNMNCRDASTGIVFSETGSGTAPSVKTSESMFHAIDSTERTWALASGHKYYANDNENLWSNGDDVVIEILFRQSATTNAGVFGNATGIGTKGVLLTTTGTAATFRVGDGTTNLTAATAAASQNYAWSHAIMWIDDSADFGICLNGTCATNSSIATVGDWSAGGSQFALGTSADGSLAYGGAFVVFMRAWKKASGGALTGSGNSTEIQNIQFARMATIFGLNATIAAGASAPTTIARASVSTLDHIDTVNGTRQLYKVGYRTPRVMAINDDLMYLSEPQSTNLLVRTEDLTSSWNAITAGDNAVGNIIKSPEINGAQIADGIDGNNSSAEHGLTQNATLSAATHTFSVFASASTKTWVALRTGVANTTTFFDLTACAACNIGSECSSAIGTTGSAVIQARALRYAVDTDSSGTADLEWCRVSISFTATAASTAHDLLCADGDNDLIYTDADATSDCYFHAMQSEAFPVATSVISSFSSATTRVADDLRYSGTSHYTGSPSTLDVQAQCAPFNVETSSTFASVGTGSTNYGSVGINATNDRAQSLGTVTTAQWDISASSGDAADGSEHGHRVVMITNDIEAFFDTTSTGTDVSATVPTSASSFLYLGSRGGTAQNPRCSIERVRLWSVEATPTVAP